MKKVIILGIVVYVVIQAAISFGYKKEKESDYILDLIDSNKEVEKSDTLYKIIHPRDTTPYHGKWVDVEPN